MDVKHQLAVEVFQLSRRWRSLVDERMRPIGLTKAGWVVLYWLSQHPEGVTQRELAEAVAVETSTLTRQLDAMAAQGLITRRPVDGDRRVKRVALSAEGWAALERGAPLAEAVRDELLAGLSEEHLRIAVEVLRHAHARAAHHEAAAG